MSLSESASNYRARVEAVREQRSRWRAAEGANRWDKRAASFRLDPRREIDANLAAVADYIQPEDVVLDIGGGAGRVSLPLALRCREVINVDPSPAMLREFEASAAEADIENARGLTGVWPEVAADLEADVVLTFNVTYFVADIVPFVEAMTRAARRRVIIGTWSVPPPDHPARLYELAYGEPLAPAPTYRDLLPVLWDMGILPDVRVLPDPFRVRGRVAATRDEAIEVALGVVDAQGDSRIAGMFDQHLDELFSIEDGSYRPRWTPDTRELLTTWVTQ